MKRTIWTFGDSFTESFSDNKADWVQSYCNWKGYIPKVYGEVISDKMDLQLMNLGRGGSDNYSIFQNVCNSVNSIKSNDIIIIGWSSIFRFRLANVYNSWKVVLPAFSKNLTEFENISQTTIDEILANRMNKLYMEEVNSWMKLLNFTFSNNTIIHWTPFLGGPSHNYFRNITTIQSETNEDIEDGHYSETGHIELANELMDMISQKRTQRLI